MLPIMRFNADFNASTDDNIWKSMQTIRLITQKSWDGMVIRASFQDARLWGLEDSPVLASDPLAGVYEGYVQLGSKDNRSFWIRTGRQESILHDGMLMWHRPWNLYGITFNGIRGHFEKKRFSIDASAFVLNGAKTYTSSCDAEDCSDFVEESISSMGDFLYVIHAKYVSSPRITVLPYLLALQQGASQSDINRSRYVLSPGLRLEGKLSPDLSFVGEGTYQLGKNNDTPHQAWRANTSVQYQLDIMKYRFFYEERSGDGDDTDDLLTDFEPFFGAGHRFRGFGDYIGASNIRDVGMSIQSVPFEHWLFKLDYHFFQLSNSQGNWYGLGNALRGRASGDDPNLGHEIDIIINWKPSPITSVLFGHVLFLPTGEGASIGGSDMSQATYVWLRIEDVPSHGHRN